MIILNGHYYNQQRLILKFHVIKKKLTSKSVSENHITDPFDFFKKNGYTMIQTEIVLNHQQTEQDTPIDNAHNCQILTHHLFYSQTNFSSIRIAISY